MRCLLHNIHVWYLPLSNCRKPIPVYMGTILSRNPPVSGFCRDRRRSREGSRPLVLTRVLSLYGHAREGSPASGGQTVGTGISIKRSGQAMMPSRQDQRHSEDCLGSATSTKDMSIVRTGRHLSFCPDDSWSSSWEKGHDYN